MKLCIVTGEASGDIHAADVVQRLKGLDASFEAFGLGGDSLRGQGVEILHDVKDLSAFGLFNVIRQLPMYRAVFAHLVGEIESRRPDAVLLVDFPDFNLRLARECKKRRIRVIYYISPQVWAWRQRRVRQIARDVDEMLVIFPFEESFYRERGVAVTYVGHPLVEQLADISRKPEFRDPGEPIRIALMPGSRRSEVSVLLPRMLGAIDLLRDEYRLDVLLIKAPTIDRQLVSSICGSRLDPSSVVEEHGRLALAKSDVVLCSSGTATLEAAILEVPAVVVYVLSPLTYLVGRYLVRLPEFSLANIVAGKRIVPELLQDRVTPEAIAAETRKLLDPATHADVRMKLRAVGEKLGTEGASRRAAERIATLVAGWKGAELA